MSTDPNMGPEPDEAPPADDAQPSSGVEFPAPKDWKPEEGSSDPQASHEGIVTYRMKDGKICLDTFDGHSLGGADQGEGEGEGDGADPYAELDGMAASNK